MKTGGGTSNQQWLVAGGFSGPERGLWVLTFQSPFRDGRQLLMPMRRPSTERLGDVPVVVELFYQRARPRS